ncbi:MAG: peptidylprolyl isomerase [Eubacteriaceae bacterium]|nr:peptidylprolyl isomerase [Eubacteriaceae bacterium]
MIAVIETEYGDIRVRLDEQAAPVTCANFAELARRGFYDGLVFHRVIYGFMIQGGDPNGNGTGGSGKNIKGEFDANGWDNPIEHKRGVISMARAANFDSASSQFFIMHRDAPHLDGQYAAFGHVIEGMDAVDRIASADTDSYDRPKEPQIMKRVYIQEDEEA